MVTVLAVAAWTLALGCGSHTSLHPDTPEDAAAGLSGDGSPDAAVVQADAVVSADGVRDAEADSRACVAGVPKNHRASEGPACPSERAPGPGLPEMCNADAGQPPAGDCQQDSDCTKGTSGRCLVGRGCYMMCSYDECFQDSDCAGNVPCHCRDSASSTDSNWCLRNSNCRVDNDCGPGGYCSPSQLEGCMRMCTVLCPSGTHCYAGTAEVPCWCGESCGAGYFCHTSCDGCMNDGDCSEQGSACTHEPMGGWSCIGCANLP